MRAEAARERALEACADADERARSVRALEDTDALRDLYTLAADYSATRWERRGVMRVVEGKGAFMRRFPPLAADADALESGLAGAAEGLRTSVRYLLLFAVGASAWSILASIASLEGMRWAQDAGWSFSRYTLVTDLGRSVPVIGGFLLFAWGVVRGMRGAAAHQAGRIRMVAWLLLQSAEARASFLAILAECRHPRTAELFRTAGYRALIPGGADLPRQRPLLRERLRGAESLAPFARGLLPARWGGYPGVALGAVPWSSGHVAVSFGLLATSALWGTFAADLGAPRSGVLGGVWALQLLAVGTALLFTRGTGARAADAVALRRFDARTSARWFALAVFLAAASVLYSDTFPEGMRALVPAALGVGDPGSLALTRLATWVGPVLIAPFAEEIVCRGMLLPYLLARWNPGWAILGSALIFALPHANVPAILASFVIGSLAGMLVTNTRSLWPAIALHALGNAAVFVARLLA
ncbi:MAG: hypothetical protein C0418_05425 [Coriobacteriaceae bacterium]|nr:hypothetical protein [Coriobacteriaceae bacterium]